MKLMIVLALVTLAIARPDDGKYDSKYDDFNVQEVIENDRLLKAYALCFLGTGKCTPEGTDVKKWIPEATSSSCGKCTEKQKTLVAKTMKAMETKLPKEYGEIIKLNDPEGKYGEELAAFIAKYSA